MSRGRAGTGRHLTSRPSYSFQKSSRILRIHYLFRDHSFVDLLLFSFLSPKSKIRFCSFGERAVPAEQPFKVMKRRRQQFCRRRLRPSVNHTLFYRIFFLSAINCGSHYACAGSKEQSDPQPHHTVIAGLRRLNIIGRLVVIIRLGCGCTNVVFAGIALAIVVSVCVSSLAVLNDNATTCFCSQVATRVILPFTAVLKS